MSLVLITPVFDKPFASKGKYFFINNGVGIAYSILSKILAIFDVTYIFDHLRAILDIS